MIQTYHCNTCGNITFMAPEKCFVCDLFAEIGRLEAKIEKLEKREAVKNVETPKE